MLLTSNTSLLHLHIRKIPIQHCTKLFLGSAADALRGPASQLLRASHAFIKLNSCLWCMQSTVSAEHDCTGPTLSNLVAFQPEDYCARSVDSLFQLGDHQYLRAMCNTIACNAQPAATNSTVAEIELPMHKVVHKSHRSCLQQLCPTCSWLMALFPSHCNVQTVFVAWLKCKLPAFTSKVTSAEITPDMHIHLAGRFLIFQSPIFCDLFYQPQCSRIL